MTFMEIKELHEMGFTPDQILTLQSKPEQPEQPDQPEQPEQPEQPDQPDTRITELQTELATLKKQLQSMNRQSARIETPPADDLMAKTDKIMAELIRPTMKGEN